MANIAILGFGTIGSGVYEVLAQNKESICKKASEEVTIKKIMDCRDFGEEGIREKLTKDFSTILNDDSIGVVVETMGGVEPAYRYVKQALEAGKHVVTSNKELVARHGCELLQLAKKCQVNFFFEASTGGGIPVIRPIAACLTAESILEISGILNGTTNFILTKMEQEGKDFAEVLQEAQTLGYAEKDPSADVDGFDACRKIAILSSVSYGKNVNFEKIHTEGIRRISKDDMAYAKKMQHTIKLIGKSKRIGNGVCAYVAPVLLPDWHPLAVVNDVYNGISVVGNMLGDVLFCGKGAGKLPTASAVVADIIAAVRYKKNSGAIHWEAEEMEVVSFSDVSASYLVRVAFSDKEEAKTHCVRLFPKGEIIELPEISDEFGLVTEQETEGILEEKLRRLQKESCITGIRNKIRIEGSK